MAADEAPHGAAQANGAPAAVTNGSSSAFSLSFSAAKKRTRVQGQVQPVEADRRELVTGFAGGRLEAVDAAAPVQAGKRVIPRLENTFQVTSSGGPRKFDPSR